MELIKGFKKTTIQQDPIATFNNLMGQLDANFRTIEAAFNGVFQGIEGITGGRVGRAVLVGGTVTVLDSKITNKSNIYILSQINGGTPGFLRCSARVEGVSFTVLSSNGADTSTFAYLILEPV